MGEGRVEVTDPNYSIRLLEVTAGDGSEGDFPTYPSEDSSSFPLPRVFHTSVPNSVTHYSLASQL
jgi:hypothetical protein